MEGFALAAQKGDIRPGEMKLVEAADEQVVLANVGGTLVAFSNTCTHEECDLAFGLLEGDEVECDCHGSRFNVRSGIALNGPAVEPLPLYSVRIEGDDVFVGPP